MLLYVPLLNIFGTASGFHDNIIEAYAHYVRGDVIARRVDRLNVLSNSFKMYFQFFLFFKVRIFISLKVISTVRVMHSTSILS